jgi:ribosomal protein S18 acetylase RimI-like enzyme
MERVERVHADDQEAVSYLEYDLARNALEIWGLKFESDRFELYVLRDEGRTVAHLSNYHAPEADYVNIGGRATAILSLLPLVPRMAVVTFATEAFEAAKGSIRPDSLYRVDLMLVRRGEERLAGPRAAVELSEKHADDYTAFSPPGSPQAPIDYAREQLARHPTFGVFEDGRLVAVASLGAFLPDMAVIMAVETLKESRRKGHGSAVVSAAVREALNRSKACSLWVASENAEAVSLYLKLGFKKVGEVLWADVGTGQHP